MKAHGWAVAGDPSLFYRLDADAQADVIGLLLAQAQDAKAATAAKGTDIGALPKSVRALAAARQGGG